MIPKHFLESVRYSKALPTALRFAPPFSSDVTQQRNRADDIRETSLLALGSTSSQTPLSSNGKSANRRVPLASGERRKIVKGPSRRSAVIQPEQPPVRLVIVIIRQIT